MLIATKFTYKEFTEKGFDFAACDYKANLLYYEGAKLIGINNALIFTELNVGIVVNKHKTIVFVIDILKNKGMTIQRIDAAKVN